MSDNQEPDVKVREKGKGDEGEYIYKICIVGEPAVGKTSLIRKFVKDKFEVEHIQTVGVDISKQPMRLEINGKKVEITLLFWDMAGQIQFHLLHKVYLNGAMGILLVFDLTRPKSLINAEAWHKRVGQYGYDTKPMILIGNKSDLERKVTPSEIEEQRKKLGIDDYIETSALEGNNLDKLFELIARKVYTADINK